MQAIERDVDSELSLARQEYQILNAKRELLLEELRLSQSQTVALQEQVQMETEDALSREFHIQQKIAENEMLIASYPTEHEVEDAKSQLQEIEREIERCLNLKSKVSEVLNCCTLVNLFIDPSCAMIQKTVEEIREIALLESQLKSFEDIEESEWAPQWTDEEEEEIEVRF